MYSPTYLVPKIGCYTYKVTMLALKPVQTAELMILLWQLTFVADDDVPQLVVVHSAIVKGTILVRWY